MLQLGEWKSEWTLLRTELTLGPGPLSNCARTGEIQLMTNVENYENYGINTESTKSEIDIPCVGKGNKLQAVLNIKSRQAEMYDHIDK